MLFTSGMQKLVRTSPTCRKKGYPMGSFRAHVKTEGGGRGYNLDVYFVQWNIFEVRLIVHHKHVAHFGLYGWMGE